MLGTGPGLVRPANPDRLENGFRILVKRQSLGHFQSSCISAFVGWYVPRTSSTVLGFGPGLRFTGNPPYSDAPGTDLPAEPCALSSQQCLGVCPREGSQHPLAAAGLLATVPELAGLAPVTRRSGKWQAHGFI